MTFLLETLRLGLTPLTCKMEAIHEETRIHTPPDWWNYYWGTEPLRSNIPDPNRRYATFFKAD